MFRTIRLSACIDLQSSLKLVITIDHLTLGYNSTKILMNAHCVLYGTNRSLRAILFFTVGGLIIFVDTNCSMYLLDSELTKLTMEFAFSGFSSCHSNKIYVFIYYCLPLQAINIKLHYYYIICTICTWTTSGMFFRKSKTVS